MRTMDEVIFPGTLHGWKLLILFKGSFSLVVVSRLLGISKFLC